jgi:hypothetical protein
MIGVGSLNVIALSSSGLIQIHDLATQQLTQELSTTNCASSPSNLLANKVGTLVPSTQRRRCLRMLRQHISVPHDEYRDAPVPARRAKTPAPLKPTFTRSRIMLQCNNSIYSLTVKSRISQIEELIGLQRLKECKNILEKRPVSVNAPPDPDDVRCG